MSKQSNLARVSAGLVQEALDYAEYDAARCRVRRFRVPASNIPTTTIALQAQSGTPLQFKIPAGCLFNPANSYFQYQVSVPVGGAGFFSCFYEDACDLFRQCSFSDGSFEIFNINQADVYVHTMRQLDEPIDSFRTRDRMNGMYPCNQTVNQNIYPFSIDGLWNGTSNASSVSYLEDQHLWVGPTPNTAYTVTRQFKLSDLKGTLFGLNRNLMFNRDMYINMNTQAANRIGFYTLTPNNPNGSSAAGGAIGTNVAFGNNGAVSLINLYLYLGVEKNLDIVNQVAQAVSTGMKMLVPWPLQQRWSTAGDQSNGNLSFSLNNSYGRVLKRVVYRAYNAGEFIPCYSWDCSNVNGTKISSYYTTMDGTQLQDNLINCYNPNNAINPANQWNNPSQFADDWAENYRFLAGTSVNSYPMYQTHWLHVDSWGQLPKMEQNKASIDDSAVADGMSMLDGNHTWNFNGNLVFPRSSNASNCNTNGLNHYAEFTFIKELHISPNGVVYQP